MYRVLSVGVLALFAALFAPELAAQSRGGLRLGEKFEGELKDKKLFSFTHYYRAELPVVLRAGQTIAISATVVGKGRRVAIRVLDPNGALIGDPQMIDSTALVGTWPVKTCQHTQEEVPSSGKYKIEVYSNLAGPFTLRASVPGDDSEVKVLERRIEQLRRELAEAEQKLRALKAKGNPRLLKGIENK